MTNFSEAPVREPVTDGDLQNDIDADTASLSGGPKVLLPDDDHLLKADAEEDEDDLND